MRRRMGQASAEISHWPEYDYVIVNTNLPTSMEGLTAILAAERLRRERLNGLTAFVREMQVQAMMHAPSGFGLRSRRPAARLARCARVPCNPLGDIGSHEIIAAKPGTILRVWPQIGGSVDNAKAYRIIYRSTGMNGEPIAVSGAVLFRDAPTPRGKRDVVAWAHPTTGVVERCAPTLLPDLSGTIAGIDEMLDRGFVIAATDYAGLGGEGMHPYLIGVSEARAVLDSVRAARQLPDAAAGDRFAVWGHSQGGHAALFTGEQAASYAPELKLVGVAAAAPATYLGELFRADSGSIGGNSLTAMALLSWSTIFNIPLEHGRSCPAPADLRGGRQNVHRKDHRAVAPRGDRAAVAALIPQGRSDHHRAVARDHGSQYAGSGAGRRTGVSSRRARPTIWCDRRSPCSSPTDCARPERVVEMKMLEGVSHSFAGYDSAGEAVAWMADRFRGHACSQWLRHDLPGSPATLGVHPVASWRQTAASCGAILLAGPQYRAWRMRVASVPSSPSISVCLIVLAVLALAPMRHGRNRCPGRQARRLRRRHPPRQAGHRAAHPPAGRRRACERQSLPHHLSLDGPQRRTHRRFRHRHLSGGPGAEGRPQRHRLGALHDRRRRALRADAAAQSFRHHRRSRADAVARLCRRRHRLRRPRAAGRARLSRRHQRGAVGTGSACAPPAI